MTRETKIGLLVGLGFIVVFAVLLSHTGNVPPPGESVTSTLAQKPPVNQPVLSGGMRSEIGQPEPVPAGPDNPPTGSSPEADPIRPGPEDRVVRLDDLPDLPAPTAFDRSKHLEVASVDSSRSATADSPVSILSMNRKAPDLPLPPEPEPSLPHDPPTKSVDPDRSNTELASNTGGKTAPVPTQPKEYVVQSKDSLAKIAQKQYQSNDPRVVQFLVKSNEGRIKDADRIREGQTLLIPSLPPEMFERVPAVDVHLASGAVDDLIKKANSTQRKAPTGSSTEKAQGGSVDKPETADVRKSPGGDTAKPTTSEPPKPKGASDSLRSDTSKSTAAKATTAKAANPEKEVSPKSELDSKPADDSALRLSLSGLVPVRPSAGSTATKNPPKASGTESTKAKETRSNKPEKSPRETKGQSADASGKGDQLYRWYQVKPNDTMGSIAKRELGESQHWQEIRKLNDGIDPQRLKPGDRIRLPRKPLSSSSSVGRASA